MRAIVRTKQLGRVDANQSLNSAGSSASSGFTLVELLITMVIFAVIMTGVYQAFIAQMRNTSREFRLAESEIELGLLRNVITRDLEMAGYGLADDYAGAQCNDVNVGLPATCNPRSIKVTNGNPDEIYVFGTALGREARQSQHWSYVQSLTSPILANWGDNRESVEQYDRLVVVEPSTKTLLQAGGSWLMRFDGTNLVDILDNPAVFPVGSLVYGLRGHTALGFTADEPTLPYYVVRYYLSTASTLPTSCAPGTRNLLRVESRRTETPDDGDAIFSCVRDMEVILGLDTDENGTIDLLDNGGVTAAGYTQRLLQRRLKQIQVYLLVQVGEKDLFYTYPSSTVLVGNQTVTLTAAQRQYRWRVIPLIVTPRNIR